MVLLFNTPQQVRNSTYVPVTNEVASTMYQPKLSALCDLLQTTLYPGSRSRWKLQRLPRVQEQVEATETLYPGSRSRWKLQLNKITSGADQEAKQRTLFVTPDDQEAKQRTLFVTPDDQEAKQRTLFVTPDDQEAKQRTLFVTPDDQEAKQRTLFVTPDDQEAKQRTLFVTPDAVHVTC